MTADYRVAVKDHLIDLWEEDDQLIALIEMINATDHLHIENIAVRPDRQGRGFGGVLLDHAEDVAHALGHDELRLFTNAAFVSNIEFYSKRGYEDTGREEIGPGRTTVHMSKRLSARHLSLPTCSFGRRLDVALILSWLAGMPDILNQRSAFPGSIFAATFLRTGSRFSTTYIRVGSGFPFESSGLGAFKT